MAYSLASFRSLLKCLCLSEVFGQAIPSQSLHAPFPNPPLYSSGVSKIPSSPNSLIPFAYGLLEWLTN